jgi:hypothetical protein
MFNCLGAATISRIMARDLPIHQAMGPSVVVIARSEQEVALRKRLGTESSVALFSDYEALKALEMIIVHPPKILALDRSFAFTARGAALVARLKAEPRLCGIDLRVLAEDETNAPVILSTRALGLEGAILKTSHPLDYCGTRRAPRFAVSDDANVVVNGERGRLVNLSSTGAQLLAFVRLRPDEPLRLALVDADAAVKVRGVVAWSAAEPVHGALTYRAGVEFINPDPFRLDGFCVRHMTSGDVSGDVAPADLREGGDEDERAHADGRQRHERRVSLPAHQIENSQGHDRDSAA